MEKYNQTKNEDNIVNERSDDYMDSKSTYPNKNSLWMFNSCTNPNNTAGFEEPFDVSHTMQEVIKSSICNYPSNIYNSSLSLPIAFPPSPSASLTHNYESLQVEKPAINFVNHAQVTTNPCMIQHDMQHSTSTNYSSSCSSSSSSSSFIIIIIIHYRLSISNNSSHITVFLRLILLHTYHHKLIR
ncbi:uncharacterized protein DC041_0012997 [Schistosoma bovis]|uniref:Uncharacterized protein n=1 Tax=Schistosoma bovis TaxID=6184 RepID=A0A430QUM5_SCHBO|nr:uncharacterized protein DC041_0012997 [Schistosoma bovis]